MPANPRLLEHIQVVQLGVGMATALVSKFLSELGARVVRVEPPGGDPFMRHYPAYALWLSGTQAHPAEQVSDAQLQQWLAQADICLLGGEDHPAVPRTWVAAELAQRHPHLVLLDLQAAPANTPHADLRATEVLVQARSGLACEQWSTRPVFMGFAPANQGAAMRGLVGLLAALHERSASGLGQVVSTSLLEGAMSWLTGKWSVVEKPTDYTQFTPPKDPSPLIFRCADGVYIHIVLGATGSKYRMYQVLGIDDPSVKPTDNGMPTHTNGKRNYYGPVDLLAEHVARFNSRDLLKSMWGQGLPAAAVWPPGRCWRTPQIRHNAIIKTTASGHRYVGHPLQMQHHPGPLPPPASRPVTQPLEGVRVIDFGTFVAGPFAGQLLTDLGADVIKVESLAGDPHRLSFRSHSTVNRGKRPIVLDLKQDEGRRLALDLCAGADIVMNNFRPGVMARLGLDSAPLQARRPGIIVLECPAFGSTGPLQDYAGFDMVMQAYCGHEFRLDADGTPPMWNRTSMVDFMNGFCGAVGVLAALVHRQRTGEGTSIVSPLVNAGVALLAELVQHPDGHFEGQATPNATQTGFHPAECFYQAQDGWLALSVRDAAAAQALADTLGLHGQLATDPLQWDEAEFNALTQAIAPQPLDALLERLRATGVWAERCQQNMEATLLNDPTLWASQTVHRAVDPVFGELREPGVMLRFSRSAAGHQRPALAQGAATVSVLTELGHTPQTLQPLRDQRVVA